MSIKFLVSGGGGYFGFWGGGECRFYFYGRADFSEFDFCCSSKLRSVVAMDVNRLSRPELQSALPFLSAQCALS